MAERNIVERVIALEGVELMANLTSAQLARIASIAREVSYPPGRIILEAGQPLDALFVVMEGAVELIRAGEVRAMVHSQEVLGAWALFEENDPMPFTAKAREDTHLLRIAREDFYDLLSDNTEIISAIFSTLARRFRKLVEQ
jgi:CRP/FNR family cyclic AMP-dependent transcriptional regulator